MKILFILPDVNSFHKLEIHFGIAYVTGFLKAKGYKNIRFLSVARMEDYEKVIKEVLQYKPDIVGFTSVETQFGNVIKLSKLIKENYNCIIVCGGVFPTIFPECIKDAEYLDVIFRGESEIAFLKFVRAIERNEDYHNIENICYINGKEGHIIKNKLLPLENNLDLLGFPDREIFNFQDVIDSYGGTVPFMFNRGCPYNCAFCSNHVLASVYGKRSNVTRRRSVDSCIEEIRAVSKQYKFDIIHIWDDLFTSNRKWLYEFLDKYKARFNKPFMCTTRSNLCDDDLFRRLKEGGCYRVHMSIESGNDFIRNNIIRRNISKDAIMRSFGLAKKYKIEVNATSIIGLPFETEDMLKETIDILALLKVESPGVNVFYPYKGTKLREVCEEYGMVNSGLKYDIQERRESILDLPHISKKTLKYYQDNFEDLVRKKEGIMPYFKYKTKKVAKKILPLKVQEIIKG